jgi:quinoprotein relay system zinc metallohydrolase 2
VHRDWFAHLRKTFATRILVIIAVAIVVANTSHDVAAQDNLVQEKPLDIREIAPGVYAHQAPVTLMDEASLGDIANIGFIVGDDAVAVIDTGGAVSIGRRLLAAIKTVTAKPIRYVINTHEHPDHVFGNAAFAMPGVTFVGHKNLPRALTERGPHYLETLRHDMGEALLKDVRLIVPTLLVDHEMRLDLGHRVLLLQAWPPMHTDCDLTILDETTGTLFAGDLVFLQHLPVIDGSVVGWLKSMDALSKIPAHLVIPGHGPIGVPWPQALDAEKSYFLKLTQDLRGMISKGTDIAVAAHEAAQSEAGKWQLFDAYNPRNATTAYAELEWE